MGTRGRKSAASRAVAKPVTERPAPPVGLTEFQAREWRAIVDRMPADWFTRENFPLLAQYVRHIENAAKLAAAVEAFPVEAIAANVGTYDKMTKMLEREGRALSSLATRMRLSQQSRYDLKAAATATRKAGTAPKKPWEA